MPIASDTPLPTNLKITTMWVQALFHRNCKSVISCVTLQGLCLPPFSFLAVWISGLLLRALWPNQTFQLWHVFMLPPTSNYYQSQPPNLRILSRLPTPTLLDSPEIRDQRVLFQAILLVLNGIIVCDNKIKITILLRYDRS